MKTNHPPILYLLFIVSLFLFTAHTSYSQSVDLGALTATNIQASRIISQTYPIGEVFNGVTNISNDGWLVEADTDHFASWEINPFENTVVDTNVYNGIQFTLTIYSGLAIDDLNRFSFRVADADGTFNDFVTDFDSLNSQQNYFPDQTKILTISSDATGLITAENPEQETLGQTIHSIVFSVPHTTRKMQLVTDAGQAELNANNFTIQEIGIVATAVIVPEPSTYALIFGLIAVGLIASRQRAFKNKH